MTELAIRAEAPGDHARVAEIVAAAFDSDGEATLVAELRTSARPRLSLVAEFDGEVVGHVFFSPVRIEGAEGAPPVAGLAPLAVAPERQRLGVGSALVRVGLEACEPIGWQAVFLLGDPAYYARFGFTLAAPHGLHYENEFFDSAFQYRELTRGALSDCTGYVRYHEAFAAL